MLILFINTKIQIVTTQPKNIPALSAIKWLMASQRRRRRQCKSPTGMLTNHCSNSRYYKIIT